MAGPIRSDGYDYDGDWEAYHEFFHNPENELSEEERLFLEEEAELQDKLYRDLAITEEEREDDCTDLYGFVANYDHDADPQGYYDICPDDICPDCHMTFDDTYCVSVSHRVCECSPLYPNLRPDDLRSSPPCSCNVVRYGFLGTSICSCTSPDLYALLERKHVLIHGHKPELLNQPAIDHHPF